jgi:hypothetical protein
MGILNGLVVSCKTGAVLRDANESECLLSFKSAVQRSQALGRHYWGNCVGAFRDSYGEDVFVRREDVVAQAWVPEPMPVKAVCKHDL